MTEISWKENLRIAWFGSFLTGASISLVVPFYAHLCGEFGYWRGSSRFLCRLSHLCFCYFRGAFSPIWGILADKYGRKPMMIRAGLAMTITMGRFGLCTKYLLANLSSVTKWCICGFCS